MYFVWRLNCQPNLTVGKSGHKTAADGTFWIPMETVKCNFDCFSPQMQYMGSLCNKSGHHLMQAMISRSMIETLQTSFTFEGRTGKVAFQGLTLWTVLKGKSSKNVAEQ